jgi:hypothetical protein
VQNRFLKAVRYRTLTVSEWIELNKDAITRLSVVAEAMNVAEMAASQATAGGTFTEEADQYFALPVHAEFSEAIPTSFKSNHSSI